MMRVRDFLNNLSNKPVDEFQFAHFMPMPMGAKILGILPQTLRPFLIGWSKLKDESIKSEGTMNMRVDDLSRSQMAARTRDKGSFALILEWVFWYEVAAHFKGDEGYYGIQEGWEVWFLPSEGEGVSDYWIN